MVSRRLAAILILGVALSGVARASTRVSAADLLSMGIHNDAFKISVLSRDGSLLLGVEKETNPHLKAKGQVWKLHALRLDASGKATCRTLVLPTSALEQEAVSADGKTALLISDRGTRFIAVDLDTMTARVLFKHETGKPGFRATLEVMWWQSGRFYTPGYFYDDNEVVTSDAIASIDAAGSGMDAITQARDIGAINQRVNGFRIQEWFSSDEAYFGVPSTEDKKVHLMALEGNDFKPLDAALAYGSMAVGQGHVIYAARYDKNSAAVVVADVLAQRKWHVGDPTKTYGFLYMSGDGSRIVMALPDFANKTMSWLWGEEKDSYALHPLTGLEKTPPGTLRLSPDGQVAVFHNEDGLQIVRLPNR